DGIRDRNVTGVQTCALPILLIDLRGLKMDNCRMNYTASRSCRISPREMSPSWGCQPSSGSSDKIEDTCIYTHADELPLTMAYVQIGRASCREREQRYDA